MGVQGPELHRGKRAGKEKWGTSGSASAESTVTTSVAQGHSRHSFLLPKSGERDFWGTKFINPSTTSYRMGSARKREIVRVARLQVAQDFQQERLETV